MKKIIDSIFNAYLIYKLMPIIIIIIILLVIGYFKFAKPVYDDHESYGYSTFETARIDPMTGEIIPKSQINNYDNSNKTILDVNGNEISFAYINRLRDSICSYIKGAGIIENEELLTGACQLLLKDRLGVDFEIKENNLYINNVWISSALNCRDTINTIVKGMYREQNGLGL